MNDLERDLRGALDTAARDVPVPGDAWQRHQRRLAAVTAHRRVRRLRLAGVTAAAAAVLVLGAVALPQLGGFSGDPGGQGSGGAAGSQQSLVGRRVVLQKATSGRTTTTMTASLTREGGKGLSLCSNLEVSSESGNGDTAAGSNGGGGGCTAPEPGPSSQVPYLMGGSADVGLQTLVGATSAQVVTLRAWTTDGRSTPVPLKPLGVRGLRAFGFVSHTGDPVVQRLISYDTKGGVLSAVDINQQLSNTWLPATGSCSGVTTPLVVAALNATVAIAPAEAEVAVEGTGTAATVCLPLGDAMQGVRTGPRTALLLVGPEVDSIDLQQGSSHHLFVPERKTTGTIWRLVVLRADRALRPSDTIRAQNVAAGRVIGAPLAGSALADPQVRP